VRVRARARVRPARLEGGDLVREHVGSVVDDQVELPGYLVRVGVRVWGRGRVWVWGRVWGRCRGRGRSMLRSSCSATGRRCSVLKLEASVPKRGCTRPWAS
jgi:hypothetical protein